MNETSDSKDVKYTGHTNKSKWLVFGLLFFCAMSLLIFNRARLAITVNKESIFKPLVTDTTKTTLANIVKYDTELPPTGSYDATKMKFMHKTEEGNEVIIAYNGSVKTVNGQTLTIENTDTQTSLDIAIPNDTMIQYQIVSSNTKEKEASMFSTSLEFVNVGDIISYNPGTYNNTRPFLKVTKYDKEN